MHLTMQTIAKIEIYKTLLSCYITQKEALGFEPKQLAKTLLEDTQ